jgi:hypothetical protein
VSKSLGTGISKYLKAARDLDHLKMPTPSKQGVKETVGDLMSDKSMSINYTDPPLKFTMNDIYFMEPVNQMSRAKLLIKNEIRILSSKLIKYHLKTQT